MPVSKVKVSGDGVMQEVIKPWWQSTHECALTKEMPGILVAFLIWGPYEKVHTYQTVNLLLL